MRVLKVLAGAAVLLLAGCGYEEQLFGGSGGNYGYSGPPPSYSTPSYMRPPSSRSSCGTGRNFC
jgi:hypothetical protein